MRKWVLVVLGATLLLGTASLTWAAEEAEDTHVFWTIGECWIALTVHGDVDLGTVTGVFSEGDTIEDTDYNRIQVKTNCMTWTLVVTREWTSAPVGYAGDELVDFYQWVVNQGGNPNHTIVMSTATNEGGTVATGEKPGEHWFDMGYRYVLDLDDIPGDYTVTLTYTVTS